MILIKFNIEIENQKYEGTQEIEEEVFKKIDAICKERKCTICDLLMNDITDMTPAEAEKIVTGWDL